MLYSGYFALERLNPRLPRSIPSELPCRSVLRGYHIKNNAVGFVWYILKYQFTIPHYEFRIMHYELCIVSAYVALFLFFEDFFDGKEYSAFFHIAKFVVYGSAKHSHCRR